MSEIVRLGDVCSKASSNIAQKDLDENEGSYPVYGAAGFIKNVDFYQQEKPYIAVVKDGAGIGRVMKLPGRSSVIGTMQYILPAENVDISYLAYGMEHMNLSRYYSGSAIPHIYFKDYQNEKIKLPPLSEQRRIAAILDKVDSLISLRQQQLGKLDELVKARFVEMFDLENCPHASLISLVKEGAGLSYGIVQPGDDGTGTMGVLRPVDLNDGVISMASIKYIDRSIGDGYRKTELTGEELLITVRGTTGVTALTDERFKGMNVTRGIAVIRYDDDKVDPDYLNAFLKCEKSQRYIREHTRGATLQQINLSDLKMLEVALPKREEQEEYKEFSMRIFESKKLLQSSLTTLRTLKASLMQQYFS